MLNTSIQLAEKYDYLSEKFKKAFEFLRRGDLKTLEKGRIPIADGVFALVQEYTSKPREEARFETHDRFFDIQFMADGQEYFGVAPKADLEIDEPYKPEADLAFYKTPKEASYILLKEGEFAIVSPEEAHMPQVMAGAPAPIKKIVIKVQV
ncbi:MAG: YhcH/YjgK/YiaL family protein [Christensenellaceae bacterium]|jgi:YhcH/YjgK/YiaL family protein|nr:YhcH/YjgK/YiaL family protein [Christensenellaceae bacterium]